MVMKTNDIDLAVSILKTNLYATLATTDAYASPWNSPVYICNDDQLNFYWASYTNSKHSSNIQNNPEVFMVMFDSHQEWGKGQGLYVRGRAGQIESATEIAKACRLRASKVERNLQDAKDFMGKSPRHMYKLTPEQIWVNNVEVVDGKIVDEKSDLSIEALSKALAGQV